MATLRYTNLSVASCELRVASCQLISVSCELSVDICQLRVYICQLSVASCQLIFVSCELISASVACCELEADHCSPGGPQPSKVNGLICFSFRVNHFKVTLDTIHTFTE